MVRIYEKVIMICKLQKNTQSGNKFRIFFIFLRKIQAQNKQYLGHSENAKQSRNVWFLIYYFKLIVIDVLHKTFQYAMGIST